MVILKIIDKEFDEIIENISLENAFAMIADYCMENMIDEPNISDINYDMNRIIIRKNTVIFEIEDYVENDKQLI